MARIKFVDPIDTVTGRYSTIGPNLPIQRRKRYRDDRGRIVHEGNTETYVPAHPRDYKRTPLTPAEEITVNAFKEASRLYNIEKNDPERLAYWTERWKAQLRKGENQAPRDPETGRRRIYHRLDIFIRTCLQRELMQQ